MDDDDTLLGAQLRKRALQFERLVHRRLHEGFNLRFAKCRENAATKPAEKPLRAGKANPFTLVARTVEYFDAFRGHHLHELFLMSALVIVITKDGHYRYSQADQRVQQRLHLGRPAVVRQISRYDEQVV